MPDATTANPIDMSTRDRNLKILAAPAWIPAPDTTMTAKFVALRKGGIDSEYGVYPMLTVENIETGEYVTVHAFHTLLKTRILEMRPKLGDTLTLHYAGVMDSKKIDKKTGKPMQYHLYYVLEGDGSSPLNIDEWDYDAAE